MSNSLQPHRLHPTRLLCPWDSPGKNIGLGYHALLQGIFPLQGLNPLVLCLLYWRAGSLPMSHLGKQFSLHRSKIEKTPLKSWSNLNNLHTGRLSTSTSSERPWTSAFFLEIMTSVPAVSRAESLHISNAQAGPNSASPASLQEQVPPSTSPQAFAFLFSTGEFHQTFILPTFLFYIGVD